MKLADLTMIGHLLKIYLNFYKLKTTRWCCICIGIQYIILKGESEFQYELKLSKALNQSYVFLITNENDKIHINI